MCVRSLLKALRWRGSRLGRNSSKNVLGLLMFVLFVFILFISVVVFFSVSLVCLESWDIKIFKYGNQGVSEHDSSKRVWEVVTSGSVEFHSHCRRALLAEDETQLLLEILVKILVCFLLF